MEKKWERTLAFGFGVTFVVVLLVLAVKFPVPTPNQYLIFRTILSLAAAGVAGFIPGFISVNLNGLVRAGGALAVFVVAYFYNPAQLVNIPEPPRDSPDAAVESWLTLIDSGQYATAWKSASEMAHKRFYEKQIVDVFTAQRSPLGAVVSRTQIAVTPTHALPDGTVGNFDAITYRTTFQASPHPYVESIVLTVEKNEWKILFHNLQPMPAS